jgi:hypothetical protein
MSSDQRDERQGNERNESTRPERADGGPPQNRKTPGGASADQQIAQEPQQSTGLGSGQS